MSSLPNFNPLKTDKPPVKRVRNMDPNKPWNGPIIYFIGLIIVSAVVLGFLLYAFVLV